MLLCQKDKWAKLRNLKTEQRHFGYLEVLDRKVFSHHFFVFSGLNSCRFLIQVLALIARKVNKIIDVGCSVNILRLDIAYYFFLQFFSVFAIVRFLRLVLHFITQPFSQMHILYRRLFKQMCIIGIKH
jgi:hypothetical protein